MINDKIALSVAELTKRFPGTTAVDNITLSFKEGKIYGLVGENGAGKSTLIKILAGAEKPTSGKISIKGEEAVIDSVRKAEEKYGICSVFQEDVAIPLLSGAENLFLSKESRFYKNSLISYSLLYQTAENIIAKLNLKIDVRTPVNKLTLSERKLLNVAKVLHQSPRILILDEVTAPLSRVEVEIIFKLLREFKQKGMTIIFISHRLREVLEIADIILIMKDGKMVSEMDNINLTQDKIIEKMTGVKLEKGFPEKATRIGDIILSVKNIKLNNDLNNVSLSLRGGEIVALAGLRGQSQEKLLKAIYGLEKLDSGEIYMNGKRIKINSPINAIENGIIYVSDERDYEELWLTLSILKNISMASLNKRSKIGFIKFQKEKREVEQMISTLNIATPSLNNETMHLSGGNKQKVALAKWLLTGGKIMLLNKPTDGIDVATKIEIYNILRGLASEGKAILTYLSELSEVLNLPDRILVMREGTIVKEFREKVSEKELLASYYGAL